MECSLKVLIYVWYFILRLQMWLKESEDVTWERFIEALTFIKLDELATAVKEKFCSPPETEEVTKPSEQAFRDKVAETLL